MKNSSFWKQALRTVQFSLVALICSVALNFATAAPTLAAQLQAPTPHLAIFGWGEKAKVEGKAKQISGRAKSDIGRVEDAAERNANKTGKMAKGMAKDIQKSTEKNLSKAQNNANHAVDSIKKNINL
jgi:uncharacterized protein YjbJ (UPF0337 family)